MLASAVDLAAGGEAVLPHRLPRLAMKQAGCWRLTRARIMAFGFGPDIKVGPPSQIAMPAARQSRRGQPAGQQASRPACQAEETLR